MPRTKRLDACKLNAAFVGDSVSLPLQHDAGHRRMVEARGGLNVCKFSVRPPVHAGGFFFGALQRWCGAAAAFGAGQRPLISRIFMATDFGGSATTARLVTDASG